MTHNLLLNTIITHTMASGMVNDMGISLIRSLIDTQRLTVSEEWKRLNPMNQRMLLPSLPAEWDYTLTLTSGEFRGSFAKRVRAYYFKAHGLKAPDTFIQAIGNLASAHSATPDTYHFDFVDTFDWVDGDFGDEGSCYWGNRAGALDMLKAAGALAIRFFTDVTGDEGFGRAWVVPMARDDEYIVYNGYGFRGDETLKVTQIFASYTRLAYQRIDLTNNGTYYGTLYINSGRGYLVGKPESIANEKHYDFGWEELYSDSCYACGVHLIEDDVYYGPDDEHYCADCYYERFETCENCGQTVWSDQISYTRAGYVCDFCADHDFERCASCDELELRKRMENGKCRQCRGG